MSAEEDKEKKAAKARARWERKKREKRAEANKARGKNIEGQGSKARSKARIARIAQRKTVADAKRSIRQAKRAKAAKRKIRKSKTNPKTKASSKASSNANSKTKRRKTLAGARKRAAKKRAAKRITYKGYQMDSGSELTFAKLLDEYGVTWIKNSKRRFPYVTRAGKTKHYIPDFYLPDYDEWVEIKGPYYQSEHIREKLAAVGDNIELIYSDELRLPECCAHLRKATSSSNQSKSDKSSKSSKPS